MNTPSTLVAPAVLSFSPVVLPIPGRPVDLHLRVTAPVSGAGLPVILLSHGHGPSNNLSSLNGYAPLANHWAELGFAVLQPTHLSSRTLTDTLAGLPGGPFFLRTRPRDMSHILDRLEEIEQTVPGLAGRLDRDAVAVAGHSLGGFSASQLLGAQLRADADPDLREPRIKAGVLLAAPGRGDVLNGPRAALVAEFESIDFSTMTTPALVVAGDKDDSSYFTDMGPNWHVDPYTLAPAPKTLLTVFGGEHGLGGIAGYDAAETTDENPAMVTAVARLTAAYLRSELFPGDNSWQRAQADLTTGADAVGHVTAK